MDLETDGAVRTDFVGSTIQYKRPALQRDRHFAGRIQRRSALIQPRHLGAVGIRSQLGSAFGDSETMPISLIRKNYALNLVGRMRPGLTIETAKSRLPVWSQRASTPCKRPMRNSCARCNSKTVAVQLEQSPEDDGPITLIGTLLMTMAGRRLLIGV